MKLIKGLLIFCLLTFFALRSSAQELNCTVTVNAQQIEGSEKVIFEEMQKAIYEFVNSKKWTSDTYETHEKIECSMQLTFEKRESNNSFSGSIQIQARRPVYNSSFHTPLVNILDKNFSITYNQFEPLQYNESSYNGELPSILSYYVYMILGYDYDSFSEKGGTPFFQQAQKIVNNAQNAPAVGWKAFEDDNNRYWLVENALNNRFEPLRKLYYDYHRMGFDMMAEDVEKGRGRITQSLKRLLSIHTNQPGSYNLQVFFNAKSSEIENLYSKASAEERAEVAELLIRIDPGNTRKYQRMLKGE